LSEIYEFEGYTLHKVLSADSAPQLPQRRQEQIDILKAASAAKDLLYGPEKDDFV